MAGKSVFTSRETVSRMSLLLKQGLIVLTLREHGIIPNPYETGLCLDTQASAGKKIAINDGEIEHY